VRPDLSDDQHTRSGAGIFVKKSGFLGDFCDNLLSRRKRWEDYEKIASTIFERERGGAAWYEKILASFPLHKERKYERCCLLRDILIHPNR